MRELRRWVLGAVVAGLGAAACGPVPPPGTGAPPGFRDETVFTGLTEPTAVEFAPDGRVFVAEKAGIIKVFDNLGDRSPTVFADLRANVLNHWDRGLLDIALAPGFPSNPWVYAAYTYDAPPGATAPYWGTATSVSDPCPSPPGLTEDGCVATSRVTRLQAAGNVRTGSEQVLVSGWCQQYPSHTVGTVTFGPDGALYVTGGDGASFQFVDYGQDGDPTNPCGDPPSGVGGTQTPPSAEGGALRAQDLRTSADPVGLHGSVLRLDPATGQAAAGNPLASSADLNARRIIATGLRNPFRLTFRPGTNELWIGDVGWNRSEEVNRVADRFGTVENFGWPCYEGNVRQPGYDGANLTICEDLYTAGGVTAPYFTYGDAFQPEGAPCGGGRTISGLAFYNGTTYPTAYRGALFFTDYTRYCLYVMRPSSGLPDPGNIEAFSTTSVPVQLQTGPGGDLFYVGFDGTIHRITYSANRPPQAVVQATPTSGAAPLAVSFDGRSSSDPDGDALSFAWDLDDDGAFDDDGTGSTASWTYEEAGTHTARLRVTDSRGASATTSVDIEVGGAPTAVIDTPAVDSTWAVGDSVSFSGHGTDPEDGALPASALSWALVLHHCSSATTCHEHPIGTFAGVASGTFAVPDHEPPSYLELTLTATDRTGLRGTASRRLDLRTVAVTIASDPSGVSIAVGSETVVTPATTTRFVGSRTTLSAPPVASVGGQDYAFDRWSDGGATSHDIVAPATATTYTAFYAPK